MINSATNYSGRLHEVLEELQPGITARVKRDPDYMVTREFIEIAKRARKIVFEQEP